jgi:hypothetical protein
MKWGGSGSFSDKMQVHCLGKSRGSADWRVKGQNVLKRRYQRSSELALFDGPQYARVNKLLLQGAGGL